MLRFNDVAQAKEKVKAAQTGYEDASQALVTQCEQLSVLRTVVGNQLIEDFEYFINKLASKPKTYERTAQLFRYNLQSLEEAGKNYIHQLDEALKSAKLGSGATVGLGAAAGAATALGAPSAAMFVAMTFGTASTGTAISSLTGIAATKAALAWLGGGALAAGGGGISGGTALLALSNPVGLALAGTAAVAGAGYAYWKNGETLEEAAKILEELAAVTSKVKVAINEVSVLYGVTSHHTSSFREELTKLEQTAPNDYELFNDSQKAHIGALHNNVLSLARLLALKPGELVDVSKPLEEAEIAAAKARRDKEAGANSDEGYVPNFVFPGQQTQKLDISGLVSAVAPSFLSKFWR